MFRYAEGGLYIGTAAHCARTGSRVIVLGLGEFGTVVFRRAFSDTQRSDFVLIAIDEDKHELVDPSLRHWGGPVGIVTDVAPGTPTIHYGQAGVFEWFEPTRPRYGVFEAFHSYGDYPGWFAASHVVFGGDSGSAVLTIRGEAIGLLNTLPAAGIPPGVVMGPTFSMILEDLEASGWDLEVVTAPFDPPSDAAALAARFQGQAEHCQAEPWADIEDPDGCIRDAWYVYFQVSPENPEASWEYSWTAMALPDPSYCLPIVKTRTSPQLRWCHENVVVL